ncbi:family A1 protease [Crucibulum laeve]|uniref:Family A1 protease n=1 Tax=Crucibulum laeve TaxID=68775 RepID=A0A5C3LIX3_9AGAR|nr:family A1 protease [Crucibulum laeve]
MSTSVVNALRFNTRIAHGAKHILARDRARAQKLLAGLHAHGPAAFNARKVSKHHHHGGGQQQPPTPSPVPPAGDPTASGDSIDVTDAAVTYTMDVGVGQPPTSYTLLIDTGNWIGADKKYTPTSTSKNTRKQVTVTYGSGSFTGTEFMDQVSLGGDLVIQNQSIGVASSAQGFTDVDGILGIGPVDLTTGTVQGTTSVPTVTDNLFSQKIIETESIGISYEPTTSTTNAANGELTFGTTDPSKFTGEISYTPITSQSPASNYWGIDQTLAYGTDTTLLDAQAGIVDTGTTLLLIATDAFQAYQKATGATLDNTTGLLTVTEEQFNNMQSMFFQIGSVTYEFTPNAQIWPRALNSMLGGQEGKIYLVTADLGSNSGSGLDFINGFAFLQRFYSVYDTTNNRVGLATTEFTDATTN